MISGAGGPFGLMIDDLRLMIGVEPYAGFPLRPFASSAVKEERLLRFARNDRRGAGRDFFCRNGVLRGKRACVVLAGSVGCFAFRHAAAL